ncbi:unnamed protein product [Chrysoparadoxa australica]
MRVCEAVMMMAAFGQAEAFVSKATPLNNVWAKHHTLSHSVSTSMMAEPKKVVVIGNGMVGHRFCEKLVELDTDGQYKIETFCEEPRAAYNRMRMTEYFEKRDVDDLSLSGEYEGDGATAWYKEKDIGLYIGDKATKIDTEAKTVTSEQGREIPYDVAVLATGSFPFVPPTPGIDKPGVFVYRTIEDLEGMIAYQKEHGITKGAVIGGGLLGLEAAKALADLGMETHIIEFAPTLMCRQIDAAGHAVLAEKIEALGLKIHCDARTSEVLGKDKVEGLAFSNEGWEDLDVGMVVVSAGIRPRDEIARASGLEVHERGGVLVDDLLRTNDPDVYAIGEVALHGGKIYGLVAPGYAMADAVAANLVGGEEPATFTGADMSTKLKLMGVDVASFGDYTATGDDVNTLIWNDPFEGVYKKLLFNAAGTRLLGGVLVGDASDYTSMLGYTKIDADIPMSPQAMLVGSSAAGSGDAAPAGVGDMPDAMQVCSCNDVSKGAIVDSIKDGSCSTMGEIKAATKACTGCGGCEPLVKNIFTHTMESMGIVTNNHICEHFPYSREELFAIIKVKGYKAFHEVLESHGHGEDGCEVCKPAVASIFAGIYNDLILDEHATLQDTNDRSLANMQRGGSYSVVPRVPGGEITPNQLIVMGEVAQEYGLYTKVTGAQRIDLFGAEKHQLPEIWEKLGTAGLESGHAYGKALRTVKSCVGSTWCRYGMRDSVGFAIEVENRYKGLRSPHKLKSAVSGCIRECAEAQCKDFGMIATEDGYNLYVAGNGGAQPVHGALLATGIDEATCLTYIDRFLMYYLATADRLERTARWFERLEGGIEHLKDVVINDKLGLNAEFDAQMQYIVDTYQDEWATVYNSPDLRKTFKQFVNSDETERGMPFIEQRGQFRPMDWPKDDQIPPMNLPKEAPGDKRLVKVGSVADFPKNGGATIKYGKSQLAVYRLDHRNEWYATQNVCPHKRALVLSQGLIGDKGGIPKVACPLHKKNFSLVDGECLDSPEYNLMTFPVSIDGDSVLLLLPPEAELDKLLATETVMLDGSECGGTAEMGPVNDFIPFENVVPSIIGDKATIKR